MWTGDDFDNRRDTIAFDPGDGVMGALEVIRTLNDHGVKTRMPVGIVNWTNEEGVRFEPATLASGVVAVGLFGATWIAGVVGGIGRSLGNTAVARVGSVSQILGPTDGLWRGAMHAFQDPSAIVEFGGTDVQAFPFLSVESLTVTYLAWALIWVVLVWGLAAASFAHKDL